MYLVMNIRSVEIRLTDEIMTKIYAFCPLALNGHLHCFHSICIPTCCVVHACTLPGKAFFFCTLMFNRECPDSQQRPNF